MTQRHKEHEGSGFGVRQHAAALSAGSALPVLKTGASPCSASSRCQSSGSRLEGVEGSLRGDPSAPALCTSGRNDRVRNLCLCLLVLICGCEWLFGPDQTAPNCVVTSPADSSIVSGLVDFRAEASDSNGVTHVEFYVDEALVGFDSTAAFQVEWDTRSLVDRTWHRLCCIAYDPAGNKGYSDTVNAQVVHGQQQDIFHGKFDLGTGYYWPIGFSAEQDDTLSGEFRVVGPGVLSKFIWLDKANYQEFQASQPYVPLLQVENKTELSVREGVPTTDSFYLVFVNLSGSDITCWARFTLE